MERILLLMLKGLALLPLWLLYGIADFLYLMIYYVAGYRKKVVRRNLAEAFPEKNSKERKRIEKEYYHFLADVIVETVKLLHISDSEMNKRIEIVNPEEVNKKVKEGKSVVLMLGHYGNWEWVQDICRYIDNDAYKASIYHPLKNEKWNKIYGMIRGRWNNHLLPMKGAPRALLSKENQPWVCGFIADHRPLKNNGDNIVEFLNHYTSVIYGPEEIGRKTGAAFFFLDMERLKRGRYRITFHDLPSEDENLPYPYTRAFWKAFEKAILKNPSLWMWSHKRWKYDRVIPTEPEGSV